ncbi:MFS transporter [Paenibacillus sp. MBLB2552]|uniref:MFS transporter n=1 Tax=Paenibacillus mellifer TaxID=2937794 RepID=A0A9X2BPW6_9BACL|nr:MFS transporter [Paenibacillus mellifer]MCK8485615.1 MFS transporter [Paenibacillus mellifer]
MKPVLTNSRAVSAGPALARPAKVLLLVNSLNALGNTLSNIFINVYWYKLTNDMSQTLLFNLASYMVWLPSFILAGWLSKRVDRTKPLWIGSVVQMLFYVAVLLLGSESPQFLLPLGLMYGIGQGFYWMSMNVLSIDVTEAGNRNWFNGINGAAGALTGMAGPLIAGALVESLPALAGYATVFLASLLCFALSLGAALLLPKQAAAGVFEWRSLLGVLRHREWRYLSCAFVGVAFRDGVLAIAIWLWVFLATGSENATGRFAFATTLLSVASFYLIGRFGRDRYRWRYLVLGALLMGVSLLGITLHLAAWTLVLYGVISSVARPFFDTPFNTLTFNAVNRWDQGGRLRIELMVWREAALSVGRITGVALLYGIYRWGADGLEASLSLFLVAVIAIGLLPLLFIQRAMEVQEDEES